MAGFSYPRRGSHPKKAARQDPAFTAELNDLLRNYAGRPTPLFFAQRLTEKYEVPQDQAKWAVESWAQALGRAGEAPAKPSRERTPGATIEERVINLVCENLGVNKEQVTRATSFTEDIGADSLDIVELVMELEEEFEITIPDEQAEKIKTVGEAIDYIERELAKK